MFASKEVGRAMAANPTWYYQSESGVVGPVSSAELKRVVEQGVIRSSTLIRRGEDGAWFPSEGIQVELDAAVGTGAGPEACEWYFMLQGKRKMGPVTWSVLAEMLKRGKLAPSDLVWKLDMAAGVPASEVPGLVQTAAPAPPAAFQTATALPPQMGPGKPASAPPQTGPRSPTLPPPRAGMEKPSGPPPRLQTPEPRPSTRISRLTEHRVIVISIAAGIVTLGLIPTALWVLVRNGRNSPARSGNDRSVAQRSEAGGAISGQRGVQAGASDPASIETEDIYDEAIAALRGGNYTQAKSLLVRYAARPSARRAQAARRLSREIDLASSTARADEFAGREDDELLKQYVSSGVGSLVPDSVQTPEIRQLYAITLSQAMKRELDRRTLLAKNSRSTVKSPPRSGQNPGSGKSQARQADRTKQAPSRTAAMPKSANASTNRGVARKQSRGRDEPPPPPVPSEPLTLAIETVLAAPAKYRGTTITTVGLYKIGTHILSVKGDDGKPVGWSLPVARIDGSTICSGEAKPSGHDTYLILQDGLAPFLDGVFRTLKFQISLKPLQKCRLTVSVRSLTVSGKDTAVVDITGLEILGACNLRKIVDGKFDTAFAIVRITAGSANVVHGDGAMWVNLLGGNEHFVIPLRRKFKEAQRRMVTEHNSAIIDRFLQGEMSRVVAMSSIAQQQQTRMFEALMGRRISP
jgi:hypothetical protein